jgi:hypothetical protein
MFRALLSCWKSSTPASAPAKPKTSDIYEQLVALELFLQVNLRIEQYDKRYGQTGARTPEAIRTEWLYECLQDWANRGAYTISGSDPEQLKRLVNSQRKAIRQLFAHVFGCPISEEEVEYLLTARSYQEDYLEAKATRG